MLRPLQQLIQVMHPIVRRVEKERSQPQLSSQHNFTSIIQQVQLQQTTNDRDLLGLTATRKSPVADEPLLRPSKHASDNLLPASASIIRRHAATSASKSHA